MTECEMTSISTCEDLKSRFVEYPELTILGTKYRIEQYTREDNNDTALGLCDFWRKIIYIDFDWYIEAEKHGAGSINRALKTLRHEIIHAFLYEMGNEDDALNEGLADALSIQANQFVSLLSQFLDK